MTKRRAPRPICPKCQSAAVTVGGKSGKCDRCGHLAPASRFAADGIVTGPMQRFSTDEHERRKRFLDE